MNPINSMKPALPPTPHRSVAPARQLGATASQSVTRAHCFLSNDILNSQTPLKLTPASLSAAPNSLNPSANVLIVDFAYFNYYLGIASGKQCVFIVLQPYLDEISLGVQFNCGLFFLSVSLLCFTSLKLFKGPKECFMVIWREKQVLDLTL